MDGVDTLGRVLETWGKRVGALLLILREQELQRTRFDLSKQVRIDSKTIVSIERGKSGVSSGKLEAYAGAFGLTIDEVTAIAMTLENAKNLFGDRKVTPPQPRAAVGERRKRPRKSRVPS